MKMNTENFRLPGAVPINEYGDVYEDEGFILKIEFWVK